MKHICTLLTLTIILTSLSSCAKKAKNIDPIYVSPTLYSNLDCEQLEREVININTRLTAVTGEQKSQRTKDSVAVTAGLVLFWPALFFLMSDDEKQEIARLKGEYEALQHVAIEKDCTFAKELAVVEEPAPDAKSKNESKPQSRTSKGR